jgi:hypothetical protein
MATSQQIASLKKQADAIQKNLNDSVASGQIKKPKPKEKVLGAATSTDTASGSIKDLSIALAKQNGNGSIKDLSIGLAKGNQITQEDITSAQGGGASLASRVSPSTAPTTSGTSPTKPNQSSNQTASGAGGYYSRYGSNEPTVDTPDYEKIQREEARNAQKEINSLYKYEKQLLDEQRGVNQQDERSTASISTLTGLAGSTEANIQQQKTTESGNKQLDMIRAQVQTKVQSVLSQVRKDAMERYKYERTEARLDTAENRVAQADREARAVQNLTMLAQSGVTLDGLKATDPEGYQNLAESVGGEEMAKAMFTLNRPQETILDKKIEGGKYIISFQNPLDGKIRIETVDLGLPPQYTKTIDAGDRILAIPDNWSGDPSELITVNKGLTPSQKAEGAGLGSAGGQYGSDIDAIIGATKATITSKFGQATFDQQMARARDEADKINLVASVVLGKADSQTKSDFANQAVGMKQIDKAIKKLDEGTKTGVLQAGAQYAANFFGKDYDPALAEINQLITSAIQPYRNSVTGAAWGDQEDGEYNMLFGSTKYSPAELRQRLVGVKDILASKSASALNSYVNPIGYYDNPFETGNYSQGGDIESQKQELRSQGYSEEQINQLINS